MEDRGPPSMIPPPLKDPSPIAILCFMIVETTRTGYIY